MFGYNPYGTYSSPYSYDRVSPSYSSPDADYLRALAQERAAQEQLLAARRAQEEARQRAERARVARQGNGIPSQYSPVYGLDDFEDHDSYDGGLTPYGGFGGYSPNTRQRRAMMEQERQRALQRELERREQEREMERLRFEEEKRQLEEERRRLVEEERRQRLRAEELRRREQEYDRQRANQFNPLFGDYGWTPEEDDMMSPRAGRRLHTVTPTDRRGMASQGTPAAPAQPYLKPNCSATRSSSMPPRSAAPPSPIRSSASNNAKTRHFKIPIHTRSPHAKAPSPKPQATPEQHDAARKIQEAYRAHAARTSALRAIDEYRSKFEHLKAGFRFPSTLDFAAAPGSHDHVSVPVDPAALAALVLADGVSVEEGRSRRPQLAYTPRNAPVHGYLEELNQLLGKLDAVESGGHKEVREKRKGIVREVEAEAERVEAVIGEVWAKWQARQAEQTVMVAPGTYATTTEQPTVEQQDEKRMDVEQDRDEDVQPEAHLDDILAQTLTESTVPVAPGVYEATIEPPSDAQLEEKCMDVERNPDQHAGAEGHLDGVPHGEPMQAQESVKVVPAEQSSAGESSSAEVDVADGWIDVEGTQAEERMKVESGSAPTPEVDIADAEAEGEPAMREDMQEALTSDPVVESVPSPKVEDRDAEPEKEGGYESDNEEVESAPTPEVDIKDADEEVTTGPSSPVEGPEPATEPAPVSLVPVGEPSTSIAHHDEHPATPALSPSNGNAESEDEGPSTPPMGLAPNIIVTPAQAHEGGRGRLESESENKVDADVPHESTEREPF